MSVVSAEDSFSDVSPTNTYKQALEKLYEDGVITGYEDGTYKINNRINRAEFVTLLMRASGKTLEGENCFPDVKQEWFAPSVCTTQKLGFLEGYPDGSFKPEQYINMAEASKIITNVLDTLSAAPSSFEEEWFVPYIRSLELEKAIPTSLQSSDQWVNRGEMAEMVWRIRDDVTDKPSQKAQALTQDLPKFESCAAFSEVLEQEANSPFRYQP